MSISLSRGLTRLCMDAEPPHYEYEDYHCSRNFWGVVLSFLRDNDFPALRNFEYSVEMQSPTSLGELASVIASPAFPDLRTLHATRAEDCLFAFLDENISAFDKHCMQ